MKIWVDDVRPAPDGYVWCRSVNETISLIKSTENCIQRCMDRGHKCFLDRDYKGRTECYDAANDIDITVIDLDHDAGDYVYAGGDYIRILDWLEETNRNYPIHIHSMNPVGIRSMRRIIKRNNWMEVV